MGTVRYTTVNGKVIAEKRNGVRSFYVSDSLGSTVALIDNTQTITDTFEYWPYGEVRSHVGTNTTPLQFVGTLGCHTDSSSKSYARARTLDTQKSRWMTKDPIGFDGGDLNLYRYAFCNPTTLIDITGKQPSTHIPREIDGGICHHPSCRSGIPRYYPQPPGFIDIVRQPPHRNQTRPCFSSGSCTMPPCCVVIGEGQADVIRSAHRYQCETWDGQDPPQGIRPPDDRLIRHNRRWMISIIRRGCLILDIGPVGPNPTSPYYIAELDEITRNRYRCVLGVPRLRDPNPRPL